MQFKARTVVGSLAPLALGLLTACAPARDGGFDFVDDGDPPPPGLCSALEGLHIAAAGIGLPTRGATIESAERVEADVEGNTNGDYCKVLGAIHPVDYTAPDIHFQVNLPAHWNGKSLHFGGGGLNGTLVTGLGPYVKQPPTDPNPLARGYLTFGSDSGHVGRGGFDGTFYLNEEALENFGHQQIKKTHDVAMWLSRRYYGTEPRLSYFMGGSQGAHEAFDAVQRYPDDYDGVVAGYPAHNVILLHLSALSYARALNDNDGAGWLNPQEIAFFTGAVYQRCDALDGVADGIISNLPACHAATDDFRRDDDSNPLRCPAGANGGDDCLSSAQISMLLTLDSPYDPGFRIYDHDSGNSIFPRWTPFEGSTFMDGGSSNLGVDGPETALQRAPAEATNGLAIARDLELDVLRDFEPRRYAGRIIELAGKMSANNAAIDRFRDSGGKLILFHGTADDFIPVHSSIEYYERLQARYGQEALDEFVRFYLVPGMGHQTGVFNARLATLEALEDWVERGAAPGELVAIDQNAATAGRTRPVCRYPGYPRYSGSGDPDDAGSFACANP